MKVKELIKILKKMPQDLEVGFACHDNAEWEIPDWPQSVKLFDKSEIKPPEWVTGEDRNWYNSQPERAVVIHS